jgi:hypothetical protein
MTSLLSARLRDHRRYLIGLAEAPIMFNSDGSDAKRMRRMADDLAIAAAIAETCNVDGAELVIARRLGIGHTLRSIAAAIESGGVSASRLAETLGCTIADLHGEGLQSVANATVEAAEARR